MAFREQNVLGLDVAMDDAVAMCGLERSGDLAGEPEGIVQRQLLFAIEPLAQ